jgi:transcriptional regulator GlxA family with amidase domain
MSVVQFERRFKRLFRETPLKYVNRIRIRAACQLLLHTALSISDVARRSGFSDPSYFTKRFQAHLRIRPLEYRRKYAPDSALVSAPPAGKRSKSKPIR